MDVGRYHGLIQNTETDTMACWNCGLELDDPEIEWTCTNPLTWG